MSFIQVLAAASLMAAAFVFSCYILINNLLMEWKTNSKRLPEAQL
jgi:hypothetical protein